MIRTKRAYEAASARDGQRVLVERLWPRGVAKQSLKLDGWNKDVAPSTALRQWFGHDVARWAQFRRRYREELARHPEAWTPIVTAAKRGDVTLVYGARDTEHNSAIVLREFLTGHSAGRSRNALDSDENSGQGSR